MQADFFINFGSEAQVLTKPLFDAYTEPTAERMAAYRKIAECADDDRRQRMKKHLPAVTWQAHFPHGRRRNGDAVASGLYILDIDHIDNPASYAAVIMPLVGEWGIVAMHMTPSCRGLRLVARCRKEARSIQHNQGFLAACIVGMCPELAGKIDTCVKDMARLSYLVPKPYFYYFDEGVWSWEPESEPLRPADEAKSLEAENAGGSQLVGDVAAPSASKPPTPENPPTSQSGLQTAYRGIPLIAIAQRWLERQGGMPEVGERNVTLFNLASRMRVIADFNPAVIAANMPSCGLPQSEVMSICRSACSEMRCYMPRDFKRVLAEFAPADSQEGAASAACCLDYAARLPKLPIGLRESLIGLPDKMKMPVLCGVLPLAMAYATDTTLCYADGKKQRLNLMTIICGPQASGKSSVKDVVNIWLQRMQDDDEEGREAEDRFRSLQRCRKADNLPPEPKCIIREVPFTISNSMMLKRLKNANGKHLFSFSEEIDTVTKTNSAGNWSQKTDLYRMAFDNGKWGQDYNSENSVSGKALVCYNFSAMGTEGAVYKFFKDNSVENGMVGRILFSQMPSSRFEHMPEYNKGVTLSEAENQQAQIRRAVEILCDSRSFLETPELSNAMREWCDDRADEARDSNDVVLDTFRRRAAVIGFRCGALFQLLENGEKESPKHIESDDSIAFARLMADYALQNQSDLFGEKLLLMESASQNSRHTKMVDLSSLPDTFDLKYLYGKYPEKSHAAVKMLAKRWEKNGYIVHNDRNVYQKTAGKQPSSADRAAADADAAKGNEVTK